MLCFDAMLGCCYGNCAVKDRSGFSYFDRIHENELKWKLLVQILLLKVQTGFSGERWPAHVTATVSTLSLDSS